VSAIILICFFLPWLRIRAAAAIAIKDIFRAGFSASALMTSRAGIPQFANGPSSKVFVRVFGLFFESVENADKKSYLVWLVAILPVIVSAVSIRFKGNWIASAVLGLLCAAVAMAATVKLAMTDLSGLVVRVQTCPALWITIAAYFLLGFVLLLSIPIERKG